MKFSNATVLYGCELGPYCFYLVVVVVVVVVIVIVVKPQPTLYVGVLSPIRDLSETNQGPIKDQCLSQLKPNIKRRLRIINCSSSSSNSRWQVVVVVQVT